jgi:hypothetical protein
MLNMGALNAYRPITRPGGMIIACNLSFTSRGCLYAALATFGTYFGAVDWAQTHDSESTGLCACATAAHTTSPNAHL